MTMYHKHLNPQGLYPDTAAQFTVESTQDGSHAKDKIFKIQQVSCAPQKSAQSNYSTQYIQFFVHLIAFIDANCYGVLDWYRRTISMISCCWLSILASN